MREQTPPLLKWLLVERPTLAGNIVRAHERAGFIDRELARAQEQLAQLESEVAGLRKQKTRLQNSLQYENERLAALDTATGMASNYQVAPDVLGTIRVHLGAYEKRGNLKSFLATVLQDSAPKSLNTHVLLNMTVMRFGLDFATKVERSAFKANTLKRTLYQLKQEGLVEAVHGESKTGVGLWRWKTSLPPMPEPLLCANA